MGNLRSHVAVRHHITTSTALVYRRSSGKDYCCANQTIQVFSEGKHRTQDMHPVIATPVSWYGRAVFGMDALLPNWENYILDVV